MSSNNRDHDTFQMETTAEPFMSNPPNLDNTQQLSPAQRTSQLLQQKFCSQCGHKVENPLAKYCSMCGIPILNIDPKRLFAGSLASSPRTSSMGNAIQVLVGGEPKEKCSWCNIDASGKCTLNTCFFTGCGRAYCITHWAGVIFKNRPDQSVNNVCQDCKPRYKCNRCVTVVLSLLIFGFFWAGFLVILFKDVNK